MKQIADFHIHSKYSRACSKDLNLVNIDMTCRRKGIDIIGTGDFTHPTWFRNINTELEEVKNTGLYKLKNAEDDKIKFLLSTEVSLIYKKGDKVRKVHIVIHAPNICVASELNKYLDKRYNIKSDGRPILGMSVSGLCKICFSISSDFLIYPAHIWTPWFSVFGSKSGFDSMQECFEDYTDHIYAYETGLSSDPLMNWRVSQLDNLTMLSNSDSHSLPNLGREANVFELEEASYNSMRKVITGEKRNTLNYLKETLEFYPEEGIYHNDGHRECGINFNPSETEKAQGRCPVCKKPLTVGVMNRVNELADREVGFEYSEKPKFKKIVSLDKIIAGAINIKSRNAKKVQSEYESMLEELGTELEILTDIPIKEIKKKSMPQVAAGIKRAREGKLKIEPGFDGQYGKIKIF